jgi:diketogulonate reductase-like aldo/keto reductase
MQHRPFGSTGHEVSVIGQGTWYLDSGDRAAAIAALRRGLDLGMMHIDTAEMYGEAEPLIAEAVAGRRDEAFLVSKVLPGNASDRGTVAACEKSLRRLKTDRLDCYLLHWRGQHRLQDTIAAFERLQRDGKIRAWGVSNFDVADLEALWKAGGKACACNQVLYHLAERAIEHAVIPWCEKNGVAVVGYSPYGHDNFPAARSAGRKVLDGIAAAHGATARQVALAFLVRSPALFTIPKAASAGHAAENAGAGDLRLGAADIAAIDRAFARGARRGSLPML